MRWLLVLVVAACSSPGKPATRPTLEADPPPPKPAPPPPFDVEFAAPAATPSGDPIQVPAFVPSLGLRRDRVFDSVRTFEEQIASKRIVLGEKIAGVSDNKITILEVHTVVAWETEERYGIHQRTLFDGDYVITRGTKQLSIQPWPSPGGGQLEDLYDDQVGVSYGPGAVIATKSLRVGESIALPAEDLRTLGVDNAVTLTLIDADDERAVYQFLAVKGDVGIKQRLSIERATGRVLRNEFVEVRPSRRLERTTRVAYY